MAEIPVKRKDFSVLDTEFDSICERFDQEKFLKPFLKKIFSNLIWENIKMKELT